MTQTDCITIEMLPAKEGDCFLLSLDNTHVLIDCGLSKTYTAFLKERLQSLAQLDEVLTLLIITHIDADHIEGAIK